MVSWSPDSKNIAYSGIYIIEADRNNQRRLVGGSSPSWSPDGKKIAYQKKIPYDPNRNSDIYIIDVDGKNQRNLTSTVSRAEQYPLWSPDSMRISFISDGYKSDCKLSVMDADGSNRRDLVKISGWRHYHGGTTMKNIASWSPDSMWLIFSWDGICVIDIYGKNQRRLVVGGSPSWSPDGMQIVFVSGGYKSGYKLSVMDADGSNRRDLVQVSGWGFYSPSWSPDGKSIVFSSTFGKNSSSIFGKTTHRVIDIWVIDYP
jgi:TolB protein